MDFIPDQCLFNRVEIIANPSPDKLASAIGHEIVFVIPDLGAFEKASEGPFLILSSWYCLGPQASPIPIVHTLPSFSSRSKHPSILRLNCYPITNNVLSDLTIMCQLVIPDILKTSFKGTQVLIGYSGSRNELPSKGSGKKTVPQLSSAQSRISAQEPIHLPNDYIGKQFMI